MTPKGHEPVQIRERAIWNIRPRSVVSFRLDAGLFDDRPPLLDLGLLKRSERFGRLLVSRWHVLPKFHKTLTRCRIGKHFHSRGIELGDDILGRALGSIKRKPGRDMKPGE